MEDLSPPERATADRRDYGREPVRYDIGVDGERQHQRVFEGKRQRKSV